MVLRPNAHGKPKKDTEWECICIVEEKSMSQMTEDKNLVEAKVNWLLCDGNSNLHSFLSASPYSLNTEK